MNNLYPSLIRVSLCSPTPRVPLCITSGADQGELWVDGVASHPPFQYLMKSTTDASEFSS